MDVEVLQESTVAKPARVTVITKIVAVPSGFRAESVTLELPPGARVLKAVEPVVGDYRKGD